MQELSVHSTGGTGQAVQPQAGGQAAGMAGHGGSSAASSATAAIFAARQIKTERMMSMYAAGLCGLIAIFVIFHWTRVLFVKVQRSWKPAVALERPFVMATRLGRNVLVRKVPGFKSAGHALLVTVYLATNIAVMFSSMDSSVIATYASRFGWMALANLAFVVFLALKNTPLAFLTAYSYERLNCLHHVAGYTMFVQMVLHSSLYTAFFNNSGRLVAIYEEREQIAGIVVGFSMLSVIFSAVFLRRVRYELFYVVHISSWISTIVSLGFHQPYIAKKSLIVILLAAAMWACDRIIRVSRVLYYSANNEATLYPLPNGGTKIVMKKVPGRAEPGKHCFIWIPAIRRFETHPFTIHRTEPVEFTVKAHNGFTRDLRKYAVENPGASVAASIDGPYGTFPDPMEFDKIVLIAGGGGATFTFGLAVNVLERMNDDSHKNIVFIWSVKEHDNLSWFKEHLDELKTHAHSPQVNVSLYVTKSPPSPHLLGHHTSTAQSRSSHSSDGGLSPPLSPLSSDVEKSTPSLPAPTHQRTEGDLEKETQRAIIETRIEHKEGGSVPLATTSKLASSGFAHAIKPGRPDVGSLIRDAVTTTPPNQRVLVAACGPDGLMRVVRDTTAKLIRGDGPGVELHCEQFGW
ncbi:ferric reductase NAD binding domain-containing protein [Podospora didyma]|uniref:Ferric reductase NAD binding domain-containing protein n=1 Tax=Podospora didyma TaxID=330526 RepID=A0AAE0P7U1_9PEZI|nr:ferric reductase NAD binding domain-containing protein [Podospora didyma]